MPTTAQFARYSSTQRRDMKIWACLCLGILLSACVAGPDYKRPDAPEDSGYIQDESVTQTGLTPDDDPQAQTFKRAGEVQTEWYRLLGSPVLDALVQSALRNSPSLRAARAQLNAAHEQLNATQAGLYPTLGASANVSRNKTSGTAIGIDNPLFTNLFTLYQGQLSLGYNLDIFGEVRRGIEGAQAQMDFQHYELINTYLTLINNVVATALAQAGVQDTVDATERIIDTQQENLDLLQDKLALGAVARSDVLRAKSQFAASQAQLPPLKKQLVIAQHRLARLTGVSPANFQAPTLHLADFTLPRELPVSLPSELVRQRPDILAAESVLHAANASVGVAAAQRLPHLRISADYTRQGLDLSALTDPAAVVYNFGAGLAAPLFDGGRLKANERAAQASRDAAAARYDATVLVAFTEVADTLRALQVDLENLNAQQQALNAAQENLDLVQAQLEQGAADNLNLFIAQNQFQRALIAVTNARLARYRDTATLFRALGGGWWNSQAEIAPGIQAQATSGASTPAHSQSRK